MNIPKYFNVRERRLIELTLSLYHNEVDAHYEIEEFFEKEYSGEFNIPESERS